MLYDAGILYREHGHEALAAQAFDRAEALAQTEDLPAAIQCIRASRAILWIAEERFADARHVLEHALLNVRALRLERYEPLWLRELAICHAGLGQFAVAMQIAENGMKLAIKISNMRSARDCARLLGDLQERNGQPLLAVQTGAHLAEIDRMQARLQEQIVGELASIMLN